MQRLLVIPFLMAPLLAQSAGRIESRYSSKDFPLTADPTATQWKKVKPVIAETDRYGKPVAGHRTEIRSRWTKDHLYLLYVCPYEKLFLKPSPSTTTETNKLWDWDVAEVFIGTDLANIDRYRELQVSPQGEWVDLDIDRKNPRPEGGWGWNSGFTVKARIDKEKKVWYGEMKIPIRSLYAQGDKAAARVKAGDEMRINCFRIQGGPGQERVYVAWQPPNKPSYHTPEAFGRFILVK
ncbi:MAG TPA: carbohydrate-binding family 9-like protein [Bryobacteraceae bacterium]|nr:carbohydrate-binding family 9-like protein [Bryobacteraceae bacterium]